MPTTPTKPLTFNPQPLIDATGESLRNVARQLHIDPALLCRPLTMNQADRYATKLGYHPGIIWGADWWNPHRRR